MLTGAYGRINPTASMWFHMGPNMHQRERVFIQTMTSAALGLRSPTTLTFISVSSPDRANSLIGAADFALTKIAKQRADLGSYQNRLEYAAKGLMNAYENIQASESRIRDTDMAEQMTSFTKISNFSSNCNCNACSSKCKKSICITIAKIKKCNTD